jgi:hypothetical protein
MIHPLYLWVINHGGRSGDGRSSTKQLVDQRRKTTRGVGLGIVGLRQERRVGVLGWNRPKARKVLFFNSKVFSISVFQTKLLF